MERRARRESRIVGHETRSQVEIDIADPAVQVQATVGLAAKAQGEGRVKQARVEVGARAEEPVLVRQEGKTSIPWGATIGIRPLDENIHRFNESGAPMR